MKLVNEEDVVNIKTGTPVLVNIADSICDIGIFLSYDYDTKKYLVLDSYLKDKDNKYFGNIAEYTRVFNLSDEDFSKIQ